MNITMTRGDTLSFKAEIKVDGAPFNLTGYDVKFTAKWSYEDTAVMFTRAIGTGIVVTDAVNGKITVSFARTNTSSLPPYDVSLVYDVSIDDGAGQEFSVLRGNLYVRPDVTIRV